MKSESREVLAEVLEHVKTVANRLTTTQTKALEASTDRLEKRFNKIIDETAKKLSDKTIEDIKGRMELVGNVEYVHKTVKDLQSALEVMVDKLAFLTEINYMGKFRLNEVEQFKLQNELIKSMDYKDNWFKKRNNLSLNELFEMYKNGNTKDDE